VVVLGRASEELRGALDLGRAEVVDSAAYGKGYEALVVLLGDQPGVRPGFIDMALSRWQWKRPWVSSVTSYRGELGHPFDFAREAFGGLRRLHGDKAVWELIEAYPERVSRTQIDAALPPDADTPEDYKLALSRWRSTGAS
jgi:molybdenum cofactor cytidylyltransferase